MNFLLFCLALDSHISRCPGVLFFCFAHAIEHRGNGSSSSPTADLNCALSGGMAIVRQGEWEGTKLRNP